MLNKDSFFTKYGIDESYFKQTGLDWNDLVKIHNDYKNKKDFLEPVANLAVGWLKLIPQCHTTRWRVKDPEHLIEKIIRKSKENKKPFASYRNYFNKIDDIIGIRVIHRFKEDWNGIHNWILSTMPLDQKKKPEAYVRKGDSQTIIQELKKFDFDVKIKSAGYRSLHYAVILPISNKNYKIEVQVRTLFEEAWGEVDHYIRYPYDLNDLNLQNHFHTCAILSGLADEIGSITKMLKDEKTLRSKTSISAKKKRLDLMDKITKAYKRLQPLVEEVSSTLKEFSHNS